jgi:DNA transformation protein
MAVSHGFLDFVVEQLDGCGPLVTKRMFGGVGVYAGDVFFAIIDNDVLYLKADDETRKDFERVGSAPFRPYPGAPPSMNYYNVPVSILEDAGELARWGRNAIAAALRAGAAPSRSGRRRSPSRTPVSARTPARTPAASRAAFRRGRS